MYSTTELLVVFYIVNDRLQPKQKDIQIIKNMFNSFNIRMRIFFTYMVFHLMIVCLKKGISFLFQQHHNGLTQKSFNSEKIYWSNEFSL